MSPTSIASSSPSQFKPEPPPIRTASPEYGPGDDDDPDDFGYNHDEGREDLDDQRDEREDGDEPSRAKLREAASAKKAAEPYRVRHPWPAGYWGGPNVFLRTALFTSTKAAPDEYGPGYLATLRHTHLKATGPRLTQWDLDVFMAALDAGRGGMAIDTTARQFLRDMQRGDSSRDVDMLKASFKRLHECSIEVSFRYSTMKERRRWSGTLLATYECVDVPTGGSRLRERIRFSLDPQLSWFIRDDYTWVAISDRKLLRQHRLAAGLFSMYVTHATESEYPLERLRALLGVAARGKEFERLLRAAMAFLQEHKLVEAWQISDNRLAVTPKMTAAKIAYLSRKGLPVPACLNQTSVGFIRTVGAWLNRFVARVRWIIALAKT